MIGGLINQLKDTLHVGYDASKTKTALRLCVGRIKLIRNKRENQRVKLEREVVELLQSERGIGQDSARIRCEALCREEAVLEAYEILELMLETVITRLAVVDSAKELPDELREAIATVVYSAKRAKELPELDALKRQFGRKFGRGYVLSCEGEGTARACGVNLTVLEALKVKNIESSVVQQRLETLCVAHDIAFEQKEAKRNVSEPSAESVEVAYSTAIKAAEIAEAAARRAQEASDAAVAIVSGASQSSMDNSTKDINDEEVDALLDAAVSMGELEASATKSDTAPKSANQALERDSEDDLALRFAALKKSPR